MVNERCERIFEDLSAMADGQVESATRAAVDAHVAECRLCAERLQSVQALGKALNDMVEGDPPGGFADEATAWVLERAPRRKSLAGALAAAFLACLAAALAALWLLDALRPLPIVLAAVGASLVALAVARLRGTS